jgi:alpha-beta hydrolase superfamily lysophospholipase
MIGRTLLAAGAAALTMVAAPALAQAAAPEVVDLAVTPKRSTKLYVWTPVAKPKGVLLFSSGGGVWPERYAALAEALAADGYAVFAPEHVDSRRHPDVAKYNLMTAFGERIADMGATATLAARRFPGVPIAAVGHSYGSLTALCLGGALDYVGPFRNPAVKAVLLFSSPGKIPGLIQPNAYAKVEVPMLMVSGDKDVVPGFVPNPADHLFPAESSPAGDKFALVLDGGEHFTMTKPDTPGFAQSLAATRLFLAAYVAGDRGAEAKLKALQPAAGGRMIVRDK